MIFSKNCNCGDFSTMFVEDKQGDHQIADVLVAICIEQIMPLNILSFLCLAIICDIGIFCRCHICCCVVVVSVVDIIIQIIVVVDTVTFCHTLMLLLFTMTRSQPNPDPSLPPYPFYCFPISTVPVDLLP